MQKTIQSVKDMMTRDVITVLPNTPLSDVAQIIGEHKFDGVPVVDVDNKLLGVINEYELIKKGLAVHLPTMQTVLKNISMIDREHAKLGEEFKKTLNLTAEKIMNSEPLTLNQSAPIEEAVQLFIDHHRVNPIPVIDDENRVVGIVSRYDILKAFGMLKS